MLVSCFSRGARYLHPHTPSVTACFRIRPRSMTDDITFKMNINPDRFNLFQIGAKVNITHNVKMFRISLPNPESIVEFKSIPSYIIFKTDDKSNNKNGTQYIPISYSDQVITQYGIPAPNDFHLHCTFIHPELRPYIYSSPSATGTCSFVTHVAYCHQPNRKAISMS